MQWPCSAHLLYADTCYGASYQVFEHCLLPTWSTFHQFEPHTPAPKKSWAANVAAVFMHVRTRCGEQQCIWRQPHIHDNHRKRLRSWLIFVYSKQFGDARNNSPLHLPSSAGIENEMPRLLIVLSLWIIESVIYILHGKLVGYYALPVVCTRSSNTSGSVPICLYIYILHADPLHAAVSLFL